VPVVNVRFNRGSSVYAVVVPDPAVLWEGSRYRVVTVYDDTLESADPLLITERLEGRNAMGQPIWVSVTDVPAWVLAEVLLELNAPAKLTASPLALGATFDPETVREITTGEIYVEE
jgi:hypothetical protein